MSFQRHATGRLGAFCTLALFLIVGSSQVAAYSITPTRVAGGNPGGQPVYWVSGLVQGDAFELSWSLDGSGSFGGDLPDLSAAATVTITSLSTTTLVLDIALSNTTTPLLGNPDLTAPITVFGLSVLGIDLGNAGNSLSGGGSALDFYDEGNIAGGLRVDVCASTNSRCNRGGPHHGIQIGGSDSFQFTLQGNFDPSNLTLGRFGTKWQTNFDDIATDVADNSSFQLPGEPISQTPIPIPEPSTAAMFVLGLSGLGVVGRRRR